jgi:hypothetical protein
MQGTKKILAAIAACAIAQLRAHRERRPAGQLG